MIKAKFAAIFIALCHVSFSALAFGGFEPLAGIDPGDCASGVFLVGPASGSNALYPIARKVLPTNTPIHVLLAPGERAPQHTNPLTQYFTLPQHRKDLPPDASLAEGLNQLLAQLGTNHPSPAIFIGGEYSVDWGMALRKQYGTGEYEGDLHPTELVSKSAIRTHVERKKIPNLIWPKIFTEDQFSTSLSKHVLNYPNARLVAKFDNSSGMNGNRIARGYAILDAISELRSLAPKHGRAAKVIVEEFIDDMPLPKGAVAWKEVAMDAIVHGDDLTFLTAFFYVKDEFKMYISDTLADPNADQFAIAREVITAIMRTIKSRHGAIHFEIYVAVDEHGRIVPNTPVILGDPNLRFGGNNKFAGVFKDRGAIDFHPLELLLLGRFRPDILRGHPLKVVDGSAKVLVLNFASAPTRARFSRNPMDLIRQIRALPTHGADTVTWNDENYAGQLVGRPDELKDTVEIILAGDPAQVAADEIRVREIEKELIRLMLIYVD